MKRLLIILATSSILYGCNYDTTITPVSQSRTEQIINSMTYTKDTSTNLCFGVLTQTTTVSDGVTSNFVEVTCVPCDSIKKKLH